MIKTLLLIMSVILNFILFVGCYSLTTDLEYNKKEISRLRQENSKYKTRLSKLEKKEKKND